jgi:hypothetical protein
MMILAAVLLVIGLIALAGMVARVNQLGSQTAVEADKAILGEVGPLQDSLDASVCRIVVRPSPDCGASTLRHFNLTATSYIRAENAVRAVLEQMQHLEASHGLLLDYEITCNGVTNKANGAGGSTAQGVVIAHLADATVWVEVRTTVYFPRSNCISLYG